MVKPCGSADKLLSSNAAQILLYSTRRLFIFAVSRCLNLSFELVCNIKRSLIIFVFILIFIDVINFVSLLGFCQTSSC